MSISRFAHILVVITLLPVSAMAAGNQPDLVMPSRAVAQAQIAGQWGDAYVARKCGYISDTHLRKLGTRLKKIADSNQISKTELRDILFSATYRIEDDVTKYGCQSTLAQESYNSVRGHLSSY